MTRLIVVKPQDGTEQSSAELAYAFSSTLYEARQVFSDVRTVAPSQASKAVQHSDYVLSLSKPGLFLSRESLACMKLKIGAACTLVVPTPIQQLDLSGLESFQTPRGYRRAERILLERPEPPATQAVSHLPIGLFNGAGFRQCFDENRFFASAGPAGCEYPDGIRPCRSGIYFEFSDYYGSERRDLLPFIPTQTRNVLEIGCASGNTGKMLKQERGCRVSGVELHPGMAEVARGKLDEVFQGEFQSMEIKERFDLIVAADVLEHQVDVGAFLRRMAALLETGGRILMSIPNIGYYAIVEDLMAGRWDYVPQGLLCITHLRFFTSATLDEWLTRLGFSEFEIHPQPQSTLPERFDKLAEAFTLDRDSLITPGFYVIVHAPGSDRRDAVQ